MTNPEGIRLQKFLAQAGLGSRRHCEQLMAQGRVSVNGAVVVEMGTRVNPETDIIHVDSTRVLAETELRYLVLNKPPGVVCSMSDEHGRRDLQEFVTDYTERLYHVGRLDTETSGLLLLTNDGEFSHRMMHPSFEIEKTYLALVEGVVKPAQLGRLVTGIELEDGFAQADRAKIKQTHGDSTLVELVVHIGKNRIVRRMCEHIGHPVRELSRTAFGPVRLANLPLGAVRELTAAERGALFDNLGL